MSMEWREPRRGRATEAEGESHGRGESRGGQVTMGESREGRAARGEPLGGEPRGGEPRVARATRRENEGEIFLSIFVCRFCEHFAKIRG